MQNVTDNNLNLPILYDWRILFAQSLPCEKLYALKRTAGRY
ncbi:hypothetical protein MNBD_ALPHA11-2149 [hydrothermal vent metagenome]|uniref:Uncharacterized protein n=1 Tax=hydrothermal vent metagenome TaxID=652676 RepID=A0A3B0UDF5_9ZZZZ